MLHAFMRGVPITEADLPLTPASIANLTARWHAKNPDFTRDLAAIKETNS